MTTPPRITQPELDHVVAVLHKRRAKVQDPRLELLGDDPAAVLDFLLRYPSGTRWVRQADIQAGLVLNVWLWWQDRRRELSLLRAGVKAGLFLTQLGAPLGITARQGTQDRIDRLEALLAYDRPNEKLTREARRIARQDAEARDQRFLWIDEHRQEIRDVITNVLAEAERFADPDDREFLDELDVDLVADDLTPGTLALLNLACLELRSVPAVLELATTHNVHRRLRAADQLRSQFASIV